MKRGKSDESSRNVGYARKGVWQALKRSRTGRDAGVNSMQTELNSAKGHLKNIGRLLIGHEAKETEQAKSDKGILSRFGKLLDKIGKTLAIFRRRRWTKPIRSECHTSKSL